MNRHARAFAVAVATFATLLLSSCEGESPTALPQMDDVSNCYVVDGVWICD